MEYDLILETSLSQDALDHKLRMIQEIDGQSLTIEPDPSYNMTAKDAAFAIGLSILANYATRGIDAVIAELSKEPDVQVVTWANRPPKTNPETLDK